MAKQTFVETKKITLSQVVEDLKSGLTKWKKDDIGFGSIESKYNLQIHEALELFNNSKIKNREHTIPTFVIIDDLPDEPTTAPEVTVPEPIQAQVEVRPQEELAVVGKEIPILKQIAQKPQQNSNLQVAF